MLLHGSFPSLQQVPCCDVIAYMRQTLPNQIFNYIILSSAVLYKSKYTSAAAQLEKKLFLWYTDLVPSTVIVLDGVFAL
jgi:hypothetical protein